MSVSMCQYPRLIIHPTLKRLFAEGRFNRACVEGTDIYLTTLPTSKILQNANHDLSEFKGRTQSSIDKTSYVYDDTTGECFPLFLLAPCRKCADCLKSRYTEIKTRAMFELASIPFQSVLFFTLTYDDQSLPHLSERDCEDDDRPVGVGDVSKDDIADFRRRFAVAWSRDPRTRDFDTPRLLIVSEYGPIINKFGYLGNRRPHYHGIAFLGSYHVKFNTGATSVANNVAYERHVVSDLIFNSWGRCDALHYDCQIAKDTNACVKYVTKYVTKGLLENSVPRGRKPNFVSMPRGKKGSLGAPALCIPQIRDGIFMSTDCTVPVSLCTQVAYGTRCVHSSPRLRIPRYFIDKLFPSYSQILTSNIKRAVTWYIDTLRKFDYHEIPLFEYVGLHDHESPSDLLNRYGADSYLNAREHNAEKFVVSDFYESCQSASIRHLVSLPISERYNVRSKFGLSTYTPLPQSVVERIQDDSNSRTVYDRFLRLSYRLRQTARSIRTWLQSQPTAEVARKHQLARDRWLRPYRLQNEEKPFADPMQGYLHVQSTYALGLLDVSLNQ